MVVDQQLVCHGLEVFVVNPYWEATFNQLGKEVQWIQEDAETWAEGMLRWVTAENVPELATQVPQG
jgi:hypothetical protein